MSAMSIQPAIPNSQANNGHDRAALSTYVGGKLDWLKCVFFDRRAKPYDKVVAL